MKIPESKNSDLFRIEAINSKKVNWLGEVILIRPTSFKVLTFGAALSGVIVIAFLWFGSYTKRVTINGQLTPATGLTKIYPVQSGVVLDKFVSEGKVVKKGEILYTLSSERESSALGETQSAISIQIKQRRKLLEEELAKTREIHIGEFNTYSNKVKSSQRQLQQIIEQIKIQIDRVSIAKTIVDRYQKLLSQEYVSKESVEEKQTDLLDQSSKLNSLLRERATVEQDLLSQKNDLSSLPARHKNQLVQISLSLSNSSQELSENEAKRRIVVTTPQDGVITGAMSQVGQYVEPSHPLLNLVPSDATLIANLYSPSRAIGFVRPGDDVLLRYQAYPYQKFGQQHGKVVSVSKTALPVSELSLLNGGIPGIDISKAQELYYLIIIRLDTQHLMAYGKKQSLQAGMVVEADILQDTRRIFEWIFEPLYGLQGKW